MNVSYDINDSVCRLIGNLGHFCEARGLDFIMLVEKGVSRWRSEMDADDLGADDLAREFTAKLTLTPNDPEKSAPCRDLGSEQRGRSEGVCVKPALRPKLRAQLRKEASSGAAVKRTKS